MLGGYLKDKINNKLQGIKSVSEVKSINKFPNTNKFDVLMESLSTGPNHSAAISINKSLYTWGLADGGRLGLKKDDLKKAKNEPIIVSHLMNILQANK